MRHNLKKLLVLAVAAAIVFSALLYLLRRRGGASLSFIGAARRVGGSCLLVETEETRFIVDCGSFTGRSGPPVLPSEPESLSFAIVTHAHLDHCGLLPELFASGFCGKVYCTQPTAELAGVMLRMTRSFSRNKVTKGDFERAIRSFTAVPFGEPRSVGRVTFEFGRAEHILGASFVGIALDTGRGRRRIVISGDLGSGNSVLLPPLEGAGTADYVIMESTYGGFVRGGAAGFLERHGDFAGALSAAIRRGGDVLIPAFTLGRTQEVLAVIDFLQREDIIPAGTEVFVDSPTAQKINSIYRGFPHELSNWAGRFYGEGILEFPELREVRSRTSLKIHSRHHNPTIFLSSSGDLRYANSPRHLMHMFGDSLNLLAFVGWVQPGSLGSKMLAGKEAVLVRYQSGRSWKEEWISPAIEVRKFGSFSAHADQTGLIRWLEKIGGVRKVFLVHGEEDEASALAGIIRSWLGLEVVIPDEGRRFVISEAGSAAPRMFAAGQQAEPVACRAPRFLSGRTAGIVVRIPGRPA